MFTKPTTDVTNDPLVGSKSESSLQDDLAKSPQDFNKKTGRALLVGTMLTLMACSSFGILCHHSFHNSGAKEVVVSETTEGVVNEMPKTTGDNLESEFWGCEKDSDCGSGEVCCPGNVFNSCEECCTNFDCFPRITQPPAGEWGKPFCIDYECKVEAVSPKITNDSYQVWSPSETIDNSKEYRGYKVPRILHSEEPTPVMDQVWYIDFNEQRADFPLEKVSSNGTHIMIPIFEHIHSGYSKSSHQYNEHETGISTLAMGDNDYSLVSEYPKNTFVEKYHTLTFNGKKDTSRGDNILNLSKKHKKENEWNALNWRTKLVFQVAALVSKNSIMSQVEAGIDRGVAWQVRRYVNSFKPEDRGKLNSSTSSAWANHAEKAKMAIELAKDPNFKRDYMKSEQHCKHLEGGPYGVDYTDTHVIFPLGVPITQFTGEMVNAPTYYLGLGAGHTTFTYDKSSKVLQMYFSVHAISRQYADRNYPGPYGEKGTALYVSPVAKGEDYKIDMSKESRSNVNLSDSQPFDDHSVLTDADFSLWNRPQSEICDPDIRDGDWWDHVDRSDGDESIWDTIGNSHSKIVGVSRGMLCAPIWMRTDYGAGAHRFGINEVAVWGHFLGEVRDEYDEKLGKGVYWDNWECFYQNKDYSICEDRGLKGI